jgi:hypothetical protein
VSDTPRTDEIVVPAYEQWQADYDRMTELARKLERELATWKAKGSLGRIAEWRNDSERYRLWRDGVVLVRRNSRFGWEACRFDTDKFKAENWHVSESIDAAIDAASKA